MKASLSVVIPCHNEEENVARVVAEIGGTLRAAAIPYELICVDSGSTDATGEIMARLAEEDGLIRTVTVGRKGYGLAVLRGLAAAAKEWVTVVSGDGQTDPKDILKACAVMEITGADLVKPRRFSRYDGFHRRVISFTCSAIMKLVFQLPGWDFMGPPKIIKRSVLERLSLQSEDRFIDTELLLKTKHLGVSMEEVGVTYRRRYGGVGKVGLGTIWEYLVNIVRWRLHYRELVEEKVKAEPECRRSPGGEPSDGPPGHPPASMATRTPGFSLDRPRRVLPDWRLLTDRPSASGRSVPERARKPARGGQHGEH